MKTQKLSKECKLEFKDDLAFCKHCSPKEEWSDRFDKMYFESSYPSMSYEDSVKALKQFISTELAKAREDNHPIYVFNNGHVIDLKATRKEVISDFKSKLIKRLRVKSDLRKVKPSGEYEEGFDYGYDIKEAEVISIVEEEE